MTSDRKLAFVTVLTVARFPLVVLFFVGAIVHAEIRSTGLFVFSFACLVASAMTDLFDGYFARKLGVVTRLGAHADPLMDKFFCLFTLPLLVYVTTRNNDIRHAVFLLIVTVLFLARDQWVTFLRSIGSHYRVSGCANWSGKLRTCINFPLICAIYFFEESPRRLINASLLHAAEIVAVAVNILSLWIYTRHYWPYLKRSAIPNSDTTESSSD